MAWPQEQEQARDQVAPLAAETNSNTPPGKTPSATPPAPAQTSPTKISPSSQPQGAALLRLIAAQSNPNQRPTLRALVLRALRPLC
jgi:predicted Zn-dependent peptidase